MGLDNAAGYTAYRRLATDYHSPGAREARQVEFDLAAEEAAQAPEEEPREYPRQVVEEGGKRFVIEDRDGVHFLLGQEGEELGVGFKLDPFALEQSLEAGGEVDEGDDEGSTVGHFLGAPCRDNSRACQGRIRGPRRDRRPRSKGRR